MPPPAIPARAASRVLWQWKHPEFFHVCKVSASERPTHGTSLPTPMPVQVLRKRGVDVESYVNNICSAGMKAVINK